MCNKLHLFPASTFLLFHSLFWCVYTSGMNFCLLIKVGAFELNIKCLWSDEFFSKHPTQLPEMCVGEDHNLILLLSFFLFFWNIQSINKLNNVSLWKEKNSISKMVVFVQGAICKLRLCFDAIFQGQPLILFAGCKHSDI